MEKWNLYVLRYDYSGNYYVGSAPNLELRMFDHWRRTSDKGDLPVWSALNNSTEGFKYYWFNINSNDVSQSVANCSENALTMEFCELIKNLSDNELNTKIYMFGGCSVKPPYPNVTSIEKESLVDDERYQNISMYLKNIKDHKLETKKGEYSISLFEVGTVGRYQQTDCNKDWHEVASVEFSEDNIEK